MYSLIELSVLIVDDLTVENKINHCKWRKLRKLPDSQRSQLASNIKMFIPHISLSRPVIQYYGIICRQLMLL
jgi:hypothetical protein